jgi:hypothetical protein
MMRNVRIALSLGLAVGLIGGCTPTDANQAGPNAAGIFESQTRGGLTVTLKAPARYLTAGDSLTVSVTLTNQTDAPITIKANSGAEALIHLSRGTSVGWEQVKSFPEMQTMVMNPWVLQAGASRTFTLNLPVAKDWPTNEPLRISAEINGLPGLTPGGVIRVYDTREGCNWAKMYL